MRTREIQTLSPSIEAQKIQDTLSKDTKSTLSEFNKRTTNLLTNPLAEFWDKALSILDMKNTSKNEETSIQLGRILWIPDKKLWGMVEKDRGDLQIDKMLAPFWLHLNWVADDYHKFAIAA